MKIKPEGYRKLIGLTQKELAELFGISVQALRRKEKGATAYKDREKVILRDLIREKGLSKITIDEIFFT
ncbi:helix-turn-helix domain-containing protein [Bacillus sp. TH19]|uniref:helix-turn-helix domain-containing protein n=1 Tax=unclassified Bacillus (in: firmicutes) TaxID=185979 RepID=UPI001913BCF0|nr:MULTISPECIES: helix-turn-helix domain-containing protein [unclassified Bacillus (in: firmicutes)]MBK5469479.1 helix-turn-helix domain-containing protein [Bacillus sp. TH19]MBK5495234.1 helix-turn-helix domain-containing protein [Bacillus sp. TH13]